MDEPLDYSQKTTHSTSDGSSDESSSCPSQPHDTSGHSSSGCPVYSPRMTTQRTTACCITPTNPTSLFNSYNYLLNSIALGSNLAGRHLLSPLVTTLNGSAAMSLAQVLSQTPSMIGIADSRSAIQVSTAGSEIASSLLRRRRKYERHVSNDDSITSQETSDVEKEKLNSDDERSKAYWERRRRNNNAAKRSREARRAKEEEIALRAAYLEQENLKLTAQVAVLKNESARLHCMLINRNQIPM
ncbi:bZIP 2 domain containing protein [Trichuris trichiura]|uniref:BZIP 2 domain containing protein n=1 Tax=Trichuris trichiura TaxID=36087 RepID=A0A077YXP7_TRITR|nr:bZIP 2 domain containing protein [Trichuris trichiura]